jgi:hemerythrin-like domain-containing protein
MWSRMLIPLKIGTSQKPRPKDAVEMLLECHERIRAACALARRVCRANGDREGVADGARMLVQYFGQALPLHVEDEDFSLAPMLEQRADAGSVEAIAQMSLEHEELEGLLGNLLPRWEALARAPSEASAREGLTAKTERFCVLMGRHLQLEEEHLFPLAQRVLTPADMERLAAEMRARRS